MNYERLVSYGDIIQMRFCCDPIKLQKEISHFPTRQYNSLKPHNKRFGLSITSLDGELNGDDLESLYNLSAEGKLYNEMSFKKTTEVYNESEEIRKIVTPFLPHVGRTHLLNIQSGGYFPPHRDDWGEDVQPTFRVIVPLMDCLPPQLYFMYDNKPLHLICGHAYFINTNKEHCLFSYSNNCWLVVMNVECCENSMRIVLNNMFNK